MVNASGENPWSVLTPSGRLDAYTAPGYEADWLERQCAGQGRLAIDLSGVEYVSSAGLRIFLVLLKAAKAGGGTVALVAPRENVREVLEVSGFSALFPIVTTVSELPE